MGGHSWYWSYSNSDVPHNYPGNKISKTTGLLVSNSWGYNDINFDISSCKCILLAQGYFNYEPIDKNHSPNVISDDIVFSIMRL